MRIMTKSKGQSMNTLLKTLLGVGLYLLERSDDATKSARDRAGDRLDDLRDAAQEKYETATDRVRRASRAIRGEDNDVLRNTLFLAAGIGVGVGVGLILAPASGDETRSVIAGKVHDMGGRVRRQFSAEGATGTAG
jgi:gas vesicle protein